MNIQDFKLIFDQYYESIKRFLYYKVGDIAVSEDIAQEVFLKAWEKRDAIKMDTIKSFLYTIAGNLAINHLKHRSIVFNFVKNDSGEKVTNSPEFELEMKEFKLKLEQTLAEMPENSRIVFLMNRIEKLKYSEIADRLNLSVKAIEKRMSIALKYLKEKLDHSI